MKGQGNYLQNPLNLALESSAMIPLAGAGFGFCLGLKVDCPSQSNPDHCPVDWGWMCALPNPQMHDSHLESKGDSVMQEEDLVVGPESMRRCICKAVTVVYILCMVKYQYIEFFLLCTSHRLW